MQERAFGGTAKRAMFTHPGFGRTLLRFVCAQTVDLGVGRVDGLTLAELTGPVDHLLGVTGDVHPTARGEGKTCNVYLVN